MSGETPISRTLVDAFDRFGDIVGPEHAAPVGTTLADLGRDIYHPHYGTEQEPVPGGTVRPADLDELRAVVAVAAELGVPLWTISRGRNFGYGGPAPVTSGAVILDLQRLDRIVEIDEDGGYAVVEPGVSPEMLFSEIRRRGLPFWLDGASSPYGSIIGTALDRGIGYSTFSERFQAICGMEVLLSDGELVRTGGGALTGSSTWSRHPFGFGPAIDGLFSQSNFGIVTKAGFWLTPEPPAFRHAEVYISDISEAADFIGILGRLRRDGVLRTGISGSVNFGGHVAGAFFPGGGRPPQPGEIPGMRARLGYHGARGVIDAQWEETLTALSSLNSLTANTEAYEAPYDYSHWPSEARLAAGIPSPLEAPTWEGVHYLTFASLLVPNTAAAYRELTVMVNELFARQGLPAMPPTFHMQSPRSMVCLIAVRLRGGIGSPDFGVDFDNEVAVRLVRDIIDEGARHGWIEYRTGTLYMDQVAGLLDFNDHAAARVNSRLKAALDPSGILSPGKSGIWPAGRPSRIGREGDGR